MIPAPENLVFPTTDWKSHVYGDSVNLMVDGKITCPETRLHHLYSWLMVTSRLSTEISTTISLHQLVIQDVEKDLE